MLIRSNFGFPSTGGWQNNSTALYRGEVFRGWTQRFAQGDCKHPLPLPVPMCDSTSSHLFPVQSRFPSPFRSRMRFPSCPGSPWTRSRRSRAWPKVNVGVIAALTPLVTRSPAPRWTPPRRARPSETARSPPRTWSSQGCGGCGAHGSPI